MIVIYNVKCRKRVALKGKTMTKFTINKNQVLKSVDGTAKFRTTSKIKTTGTHYDVLMFTVEIDGKTWIVDDKNIISYDYTGERKFTLTITKDGNQEVHQFTSVKEIYEASDIARANSYKIVSMVNKSGNSL